MKNLSLKNFSIVSLCLMGVSAVTAAVVPAVTSQEENEAFAQGVTVLSSSGDGGQTAIAGVGVASYTQTRIGSVGFSATSVDNFAATATDAGTLDSTTHVG